jgi:hypothetical protein
MELAAQLSETPLEILRVDQQLAGQTEKCEVVAVPAEREYTAALRTEVLIDGSTRTAIAALEH